MTKVTIELSNEDLDTLYCILVDTAGDKADDGREGSPESKLLYAVARQLKRQMVPAPAIKGTR